MNERPAGEDWRKREAATSHSAETASLLVRLQRQSGFSVAMLSSERVWSYLATRTAELGLRDLFACARRIEADPSEYARLEALFSPPETWLFRYPESCSFLREFARNSNATVLRALIVGSGGWCEPVSIAAALIDGAGSARAVDILATDRNAALFATEPRFGGMHVRGGIPTWAAPHFTESEGYMRASAAILRHIRAEPTTAASTIDTALDRGDLFDVIVFRNVAIYLDEDVRVRVFTGLLKILAQQGVLLVGHAESHAASQATGLAPTAAANVFALTRDPIPPTASSAPQRVEVPSAITELRNSHLSPSVPPLPRSTSSSTPHPVPLARASPIPIPEAAIDPAKHVARALELETVGDFAAAERAAVRAIYLDRACEAALLIAARLAERRGAHSDAKRLRQRALRAHLERGDRTSKGDGADAC